ncbi:serine hydrolase [Pelagerythrobacter marensis]|uniref:Serine hydrolase n=1 Tax=Pelagerythrobacter marensis TaxID=543877 RepID=A0ABZ2D8U4_9SPHN
MIRPIAASLALGLAVPSAPLAAQVPPAESAVPAPLEAAAEGVVAVLREERPAREVFAPSFLAAVSETQLRAMMQQMTRQFGALHGLENVASTGTGAGVIALRFDRAIARGPVRLDPDGRVTGLLLNQFDPIDDGADKIVADLAALPGRISVYYALLDDQVDPILAIDADAQYAIGSTFKLYVLSALARQVVRGERSWDEVVRLDRRSLPSGISQDWPEGSPVTLQTLATLMISLSDNTATDQLIAVVGRDAIAEELRASGHSAPDITLPFLTTLELFGLKGDLQHGLAYAAAGEDEQARLIDAFSTEIAGDPERIIKPTFTRPTAIDTLEWFASGRDLASLMRRIVALDDPTARRIMAIDPALPEGRRQDWRYVGYKGGSEPGVLNLTWLLQDQEGEWRILTLSWNNPDAPLDAGALEPIAQRILALP